MATALVTRHYNARTGATTIRDDDARHASFGKVLRIENYPCADGERRTFYPTETYRMETWGNGYVLSANNHRRTYGRIDLADKCLFKPNR